MKKPTNFVDPDNKWSPSNIMSADWEPPQAMLLYDHEGNIVSTILLKSPIGYDVTVK